jgi:hypothetical protein
MKAVFNDIVNKLYKLKSMSRSGTPFTRSRANSFTASSSEDMWSPEEHDAERIRINTEVIANLEEALNIFGMRERNHTTSIKTPCTSVVPMKH